MVRSAPDIIHCKRTGDKAAIYTHARTDTHARADLYMHTHVPSDPLLTCYANDATLVPTAGCEIDAWHGSIKLSLPELPITIITARFLSSACV